MKVSTSRLTQDKTTGQFSPTTRYRDYAISRDLIHWDSRPLAPTAKPDGGTGSTRR